MTNKKLSTYFNLHRRYFRSINLERDLDVNTAVDKYHERSYCNTQDYYKLCMCLLDSITRDDFLKVNTNAEQYLTGATEDPGGVCFLLLLIQSFTIHTRATVKTIQKSLYTLDSQNG